MSRVGLSICALISASVLGAALSEHQDDEARLELRSAAQRLCDAISVAAVGYGDSVREFSVPSLTSGEGIRVTVTGDGVMMSAGSEKAVDHPCVQVHLWQWDGEELNASAIARLDSECQALTACTGATLEITGMSMMVDGLPRKMVFVMRAVSDGTVQNFAAMSSTALDSSSTSADVL